jgi:hypothetical protein
MTIDEYKGKHFHTIEQCIEKDIPLLYLSGNRQEEFICSLYNQTKSGTAAALGVASTLFIEKNFEHHIRGGVRLIYEATDLWKEVAKECNSEEDRSLISYHAKTIEQWVAYGGARLHNSSIYSTTLMDRKKDWPVVFSKKVGLDEMYSLGNFIIHMVCSKLEDEGELSNTQEIACKLALKHMIELRKKLKEN